MDKASIIEGIVDRLRDDFSDYAIEEFLTRNNVHPDEFASLIQTANDNLLAEKLRIYPKQSKLAFALWLLTTIILSIVFFFVLPKQNITNGVLMISIFGAICISFSGLKAMQYYKTWTPEFIEKFGKPGFDWSAVFAISFLPVVILSFIINTIFSSNADDILKLTQEDAIATVIDGSSVEGRRINYASVTVQFTTKDGKEVVAEEDLSTYDFKKFYKGQQISIVYSKDNPKNIDLLLDKNSVREFKGSEERDIYISDLLHLIDIKESQYLSELNSISYGWTFNSAESVWVNEKKNELVKRTTSGVTFIISSGGYKTIFAERLTELGYKKTTLDKKMDKFGLSDLVFENDKYIISLKTIALQSQPVTVLEINKK